MRIYGRTSGYQWLAGHLFLVGGSERGMTFERDAVPSGERDQHREGTGPTAELSITIAANSTTRLKSETQSLNI
jgi:hypothetical protein